MNIKPGYSSQYDVITDCFDEQFANPLRLKSGDDIDVNALLQRLAKVEEENRRLKPEWEAYRWLFEALRYYEAYGDDFLLCSPGPIFYCCGELRLIVSVNKVELPENSLWKQVARRFLTLRPSKLCAIERIVHRPPSGGAMLPFKGTETEWANIDHAFDKYSYKVVEDYPAEWDWKAGLEWDLSFPMAPAAQLYEKLAWDFCNRMEEEDAKMAKASTAQNPREELLSQGVRPEDGPAPTPDMAERSLSEICDRIMKQLEEEETKAKAAKVDTKEAPTKDPSL